MGVIRACCIQRLLTSEVFAHVEGPCESKDSTNPVEREERPGERGRTCDVKRRCTTYAK
jgi:hypothetical protein